MVEEDKNLIDAANKAAERLEQANLVTSELVKRQETIEARRILGGRSEVTIAPPQISEEEKNKIDTKNFFKDTVIGTAFK